MWHEWVCDKLSIINLTKKPTNTPSKMHTLYFAHDNENTNMIGITI